ncbi:unnamed protein product [Euphydryas editha]|uniref:Gag-like protein n=1 Tax=Euphydryas editha TaxID=104508 RepID=A0AAU9VC23_EUPED|nr:unnamed protein product [Euphydryas editha]
MDGNEPPDPPDIQLPPNIQLSPTSASGFSYTPVLTAPLSHFNAVENLTRKRPISDEGTTKEIPNKQKRQNEYRLKYTETDIRPFLVHVSRLERDPSSGTTLHPIKFGQFLERMRFSGILRDGVKRVGRNKVSIEFSSGENANNFITSPSVIEHGYAASIPKYNITRMGVVRDIPTDWSLDEIIENLKVPSGIGKIIKARRINKKNMVNGSPEWQPTQSVILTFDGQVLPTRIYCCYTALKVEVYKYPTVQCFNCCRFGHTKMQCRSQPRCFKCSQNHSGDSCSVSEGDSYCIFCSGSHFSTYKKCPEFIRQTEIKCVMAEKNIPYEEAAKSFPASYKSYADISKSSPSPSYLNPSKSVTHPTTSYKKTVFSKPKSRPILTPGYDKQAHQSILKEFNIPQSENGYVLQTDSTSSYDNTDTITELVINLLVN